VKRGPRIRIPDAKEVEIRAAGNPRKDMGGVADPAGEVRRDFLPTASGVAATQPSASKHFLEEKTVTVKEAAYRLGKSPDAIYQWLRSGRLRGRQPGGRHCAIMVLESSIEEALLCTFERAG
jgi:excisionase family DNA binding protein